MAYFIYPASVSQNCDKRIVPAAAKCMERYFLIQIQDAIASGIISFKRVYKGQTYGPIVLESKNYNSKKYLCEQSFLPEGVKVVVEAVSTDPEKRQKHRDWLRKYERFDTSIGGDGITMSSKDLAKRYTYDRISILFKEAKDLEEELEMLVRDNVMDSDDPEYLNPKRTLITFKKNCVEALEKIDKDKKNDRTKTHKTGSYQALDSKIDIIPTCGTVTAHVVLVGGPKDGTIMEDQEFNVNVKVIPTIIKNFSVLEQDLLDDYFSNFSRTVFDRIKVAVLKKCIAVARRILPKVAADKIIDKFLDSDAKETKYANEGEYVNASAFHKSSNSQGNYNFASNIVMFNKDDLTDPDDSNIFENRAAMVNLFKKGWSTFAMLDPVNEVMVFISSLDGGFMHYIPYSYMMESYGSKSYYGSDKKLKNDSRPFLVRRGNFAQFAKLFKAKR